MKPSDLITPLKAVSEYQEYKTPMLTPEDAFFLKGLTRVIVGVLVFASIIAGCTVVTHEPAEMQQCISAGKDWVQTPSEDDSTSRYQCVQPQEE